VFDFIKRNCQKLYAQVISKLSSLFHHATIDETTLNELRDILISSDAGVPTTNHIIELLRNQILNKKIVSGEELKNTLKTMLNDTLSSISIPSIDNKRVFLFVGINGSGKTTALAKLAHDFTLQKKRVLCVAADTFRAAAPEQLAMWAKKIGVLVHQGTPGQDPASVIFSGCDRFLQEQFDILLIDTAGRLQTKQNLMAELGKIKRTIAKKIPTSETLTLLTIDALLGQNSFEQAKIFHQAVNVDGIILTKMDGSSKGGIIFAIAHELKLPVLFITYGEQLEDIRRFDQKEYVNSLLDT
jgi:fused signal recognition particle receptor